MRMLERTLELIVLRNKKLISKKVDFIEKMFEKMFSIIQFYSKERIV